MMMIQTNWIDPDVISYHSNKSNKYLLELLWAKHTNDKNKI